MRAPCGRTPLTRTDAFCPCLMLVLMRWTQRATRVDIGKPNLRRVASALAGTEQVCTRALLMTTYLGSSSAFLAIAL